MDTETKLNHFSDFVRAEAEARKNKQLSDIDEKFERSINEYESKAKQKYEKLVEDVTMDAEKLKQKNVASANAEVKKTLIDKREAYAKQLFDDISVKLRDFFHTDEYRDLIVASILQYKPLGTDIKAYIMERDEGFKSYLAEKTGVAIETVGEDFLGGVRIALDNYRIADCTFLNRYETQKAGFNKIRIF